MSLAYYFVIAPFLYELFAFGTRWRSAYLFPYILLSVSGLQIGFKESDLWVKLWYWSNFIFVVTIAGLAFFDPEFGKVVSFYSWEKWVHLGILILSLSFFPLHFFLKRKQMQTNEDDWDANLEDVDRELPVTPVQTTTAQPASAASTPTTSRPPTPTPSPYTYTTKTPSTSKPRTPPVNMQEHVDGGFLGH